MPRTPLTSMSLRTLGYLASIFMLSSSVQTYAEAFYGSVSAVSGVSDNARKEESNTISERQDQYALNVGSEWSNSLLAFNMGYGATAQVFSKESQEDKSFLEGHASLMIGKDNQPINLFLEHSRTTLLSSPDSVNLTENQDERDVFAAKPTFRQRITPVDTLLVNGEYTQINYLENDLKDSERKGGSLVLDHKFSVLDSAQLSVQQTEVEFKLSPITNYTYRSAAVTYSAKLRKLSYSASAGVNETSPELGQDYSSPYYAVNIAYAPGSQKFSIDLNKRLTDTSAGGGTVLPERDLPTSDGGIAAPDQIERQAISADWSTFGVCQGCTLTIGVAQATDDYLNLNEDAKERTLTAKISYQVSAASRIGLQFADGDHTYSNPSIGSDYTIKAMQFDYSYQLNRDFGIDIIAKQEQRDGDVGAQVYDEAYAGAGINYKF